MYDQSVSSTTSSPPGQRQTEHLLRLGGDGSGGLRPQGGAVQGEVSGQHQQQPPPDYSWNTLHQQHATPSPYPPGTTTMLQQGPPPPLPLGPHSQPPQQTHLQLNLPGPLPSLQSPSSAGSFWGPTVGTESRGDQQSPSTSTTSSRGTSFDIGYRQILHPDEINSDDDELDSSFHSGPSSTTPDIAGSPPKKKSKGKLVSTYTFVHMLCFEGRF